MTAPRIDTDITREIMAKHLSYDPETGLLTWVRERNGKSGTGQVAGCVAHNGYIRIHLWYRRYHAHRIAWLLMTGAWPKEQIDHINRNRADNRFVNLREATAFQNSCNKARKEVQGVYRFPDKARKFPYRAMIQVKGKRYYLGYFATREEARAAYQAAVELHHGEFARMA